MGHCHVHRHFQCNCGLIGKFKLHDLCPLYIETLKGVVLNSPGNILSLFVILYQTKVKKKFGKVLWTQRGENGCCI